MFRPAFFYFNIAFNQNFVSNNTSKQRGHVLIADTEVPITYLNCPVISPLKGKFGEKTDSKFFAHFKELTKI